MDDHPPLPIVSDHSDSEDSDVTVPFQIPEEILKFTVEWDSEDSDSDTDTTEHKTTGAINRSVNQDQDEGLDAGAKSSPPTKDLCDPSKHSLCITSSRPCQSSNSTSTNQTCMGGVEAKVHNLPTYRESTLSILSTTHYHQSPKVAFHSKRSTGSDLCQMEAYHNNTYNQKRYPSNQDLIQSKKAGPFTTNDIRTPPKYSARQGLDSLLGVCRGGGECSIMPPSQVHTLPENLNNEQLLKCHQLIREDNLFLWNLYQLQCQTIVELQQTQLLMSQRGPSPSLSLNQALLRQMNVLNELQKATHTEHRVLLLKQFELLQHYRRQLQYRLLAEL